MENRFLFAGMYLGKILGKKLEKGPFKPTRAVNRKQPFIQGWPKFKYKIFKKNTPQVHQATPQYKDTLM